MRDSRAALDAWIAQVDELLNVEVASAEEQDNTPRGGRAEAA